MSATNDNPYTVPLEQSWDLFGAWLDGPHQAAVLAVSSNELPATARAALESTFLALGWGEDACTFLSWPSDTPDPLALFTAVEGLDPGVLVLTDETVGELLASACREPVPYETCARFFGRECCAFRSFSSMLSKPHLKQAAWSQLKRLPHAK